MPFNPKTLPAWWEFDPAQPYRSILHQTVTIPSRGPGSPRWLWLDLWLAPRWRALLTWVALAAATGAMFGHPMFALIMNRTSAFIAADLLPLIPFRLPMGFVAMANFPGLTFLLCWFQPLALRLNWVRTLLWLAVNAILGMTLIAMEYRTSFDVHLGDSLLLGGIPGIAGLAVIGQRTRPWISLLGGALSVSFVAACEPPWKSLAFIISGANLIYAAVMLYGTNALRRRTAQ